MTTDGSVSTGGDEGSDGASGTAGSSGTGGDATGGGGGAGGSVEAGAGGAAAAGGTDGSVEAGAGGVSATGGAGGTGGRSDGGSICDTLFGTAPGYVYCSETATSCRFSFRTFNRSGSTCDAICVNAGACTAAATRDSRVPCTDVGAITCSTARTGAICTCNKQ